VEYFNNVGSMISDAVYRHKMKFRVATATVLKCYIWSILLYGAETCTHQKVDQKYMESSEMWCWTRSVGPPV